ncbi:redoxin domain-containing protein [Stieleria sp. JC731]|uniref:redoxin domain-containing protein n=1 Tax=Pirellulaceae TaxID=2691357 RepID=UPI001E451F55|nr:redoxin domain-containing protein [Stieleria sp. JC731]MCC9604141.1 redoxin domain-containing protein [Stieleria sp. JC731]
MSRSPKSLFIGCAALSALLAALLGLTVTAISSPSIRSILNVPVRLTSMAISSSTSDQNEHNAVGDQTWLSHWPPIKGKAYPDINLKDQTGKTLRLSDFKGKVILIEYAAVSCQGCQAFAGGKQRGPFGQFRVQPGLDSIEHYSRRYANVDLGKDVVFVQVLLYGGDQSAPTMSETKAWAEHFDMERQHDKVVMQGRPEMLSEKTYQMIPGFHLVDQDFIVQGDSCGHHPIDDLYRDLLPKMGELARR